MASNLQQISRHPLGLKIYSKYVKATSGSLTPKRTDAHIYTALMFTGDPNWKKISVEFIYL